MALILLVVMLLLLSHRPALSVRSLWMQIGVQYVNSGVLADVFL